MKKGLHAASSAKAFWPFGYLFITTVSISFSCTTVSEKRVSGNQETKNDNDKHVAAEKGVSYNTDNKDLIIYGKELIANTAHYLGPGGSVAALTNGMNCQNCHLKAGTQLYANNYFAVAANYPRFSARSGGWETIEHKVNDCMERSLNGKKLDTAGKEMRAIVAYIKSVGHMVQQVSVSAASGTQAPVFLQRAASPANGNVLYHQKCSQCHGQNGEGLPSANNPFYIYPPLWGPNSYNVSAGIFKLSKLAGFIQNNMPYGATYQAPQLTAAQAWDLAAFINSQPRSLKMFPADWPVISQKPFDYPFAPYNDGFSENQHKYGPYQTIVTSKEKIGKK